MRQPSTLRAAVRVTVAVLLTAALAAAGATPASAGPVTANQPASSADSTSILARPPAGAVDPCLSVRPARGFYAAGRVASEELTTPNSRCTTISVSNIQDSANPADRCQTFLLGFWPLVDGSLTYTQPVTACGPGRTVLARDVPNNARYIVLYDVDYITPVVQKVTFRVWH